MAKKFEQKLNKKGGNLIALDESADKNRYYVFSAMDIEKGARSFVKEA